MSLFDLFRRASPWEEPARALYAATVERAREPVFYTALGVPDTVEGRYDLLCLHAFLVLRRLKRDRDASADLAQAYFDLMFADIDKNLREVGVSDIKIGSKVKDMAKGFYGRIKAYDEGLDAEGEGDAVLGAAFERNLYRKGETPAERLSTMADYLRRSDAAMAARATEDLLAGRVAFGPLPGSEETDDDS